MMIEGYRRVISHLGPGRGAVVFDWSCLGMVSDLPRAEGKPDVLERHARQVAQLASHLGPVVLDLTGDITAALQRAQSQRGEQWTRRYARLAAQHAAITARGRLGAITEHIQADPARALEKRAFLAAGWPVIEIDATPARTRCWTPPGERLPARTLRPLPGIARRCPKPRPARQRRLPDRQAALSGLPNRAGQRLAHRPRRHRRYLPGT
jgi:hypothetical protein